MNSSLSENRSNAEQPIMVDFSHHARAVVVAFGSRHVNKDTIPFEWIRTLEHLPAAKIYVRDIYQLWYQKGLPGIAGSPEGVRDYLCRLIAGQDINRIVTIGGSMGGYAALLFGSLMEADEALSFAGQTFLPTRRGRMLVKAVWKREWPILKKHWELVSDPTLDHKYFDLKPLLRDSGGQTVYHLYYSSAVKKDAIHAMHVADLENVSLHMRSDPGHHLARAMHNSGELDRVLRKAIFSDQ